MFLGGLDTINTDLKLLNALFSLITSGKPSRLKIVHSRSLSAKSSKVEKAIYRLVQLGIISDWTVQDFYRGVFEVEVCEYSDKSVLDALERCVRNYDQEFAVENIINSPEGYYVHLVDLKKQNKLTEIQFYFVTLLLWSYEHFAYNRRQSLKNVYEQCYALSSGELTREEFKLSLESYFKFNNSSYQLQHIADHPQECNKWFEVFYELDGDKLTDNLIDESKQIELKDQLSRFLESYMSNPGLDFISGFLRLSLGEFDDSDGRNRLNTSLQKVKMYEETIQNEVIHNIISISMMLEQPQKYQLAESIGEVFKDLNTMKLLNDGLNDDYSLAVLSESESSKLIAATHKLRSLEW